MSTDRKKERLVVSINTGEKTTEAAGDNRRAGDTDGNAASGDSKSKGATDPADQPPSRPKRTWS